MVRFNFFGIPITILPWFWITLALIGSRSLQTTEDLFRLLLFVLAGFISILVHELGHGLTIKKLGAKTEIVLQAFGGFATYPKDRFNRLQDFLISAAGPSIQLILGGVSLAINKNIEAESMGKYFLTMLSGISFVWAIFNLMPIFPMDGGQLLNAILGPKRRIATHGISILASIALAIIGFKLGYLLIPIFMGLFLYQNVQLLKNTSKTPKA